MGLSRGRFTKEFKLAAVQRLEKGRRWRGGAGSGSEPERAAPLGAELRQEPGNTFPILRNRRWEGGRQGQPGPWAQCAIMPSTPAENAPQPSAFTAHTLV